MQHSARSEPPHATEDTPGSSREMREHAERVLAIEPRPLSQPVDAAGAALLAHELGVHQIELELQNEQLLQTQTALEASLERYRDLYERAPIGYLTLDLAGTISEANHQALMLLGVTAPGVRTRSLAKFIARDDRTRWQRAFARLLGGDGPQTIEVQLERAPTAARWVALQMSLLDEPGRGPQCLLAISNITDRVRMQEHVARLAAIVESSEDAIISRDPNGRVTAWNDAAARLFGRSASEMQGQPMDALVPEARHTEEQELLRQLRAGGKVSQFETERLGARGVAVPLSISLSPVREADGRIVGSAMIARDITTQRRAELALRQRLRQLDVLSQAGQALILGEESPALRARLFERVAAAVGCEMQMSHSVPESPEGGALVLETAHGVSEAQRAQLAALGSDDTLSGIVAEQGKPLVFNRVQDSELSQARWLKSVGACSYAGFPLIAQGRVRAVVSFVSTSHSELHEGDLQVIQTVCDQVSAMLERARLLEELHANERSLKRADQAKDNFIATLAHELRNPLTPIRNAVGIMRHGELGTPQQLAWCRDIIDRQVVQMTRLLEDLLDVSRVTRNKIELRRERLDLLLAVEQALEATRPLIEGRHQRLVLELPGAPIVLYGDLTRLTQVFSNLLNNAAKYTDVGGEITLSVSANDTTARIGVRDTGIGIEAQHLASVFDMFAQLAPALDRSSGGLGIGLALTRGLVELHDGHVEAYSAGVGHGSEFVVTLPIARAQPVQAGGPGREAGRDELPRRRMLVVDDNADAAQTLSTLLTLNGQEARAVFSAQEALAMVKEWPPDVAVLDIGLPDLTGYELARRIRAQPWGQAPLLVACTGWGQRDDIERARAAGFDFHLVKPIDPNAVLGLLTQGGRRAPHGGGSR